MNREFSEEPRSICHTQEASKTTGRGNLARSCAQNRRVKHEDDCSSIFLLDLILASICGGARAPQVFNARKNPAFGWRDVLDGIRASQRKTHAARLVL
jgi:hypothetical protein